MSQRVSVFGGASPRPGEAAYEQALHLGRLLGAAGCTVLTGGYIGIMEAVSQGANQAGGHVIGVTCEAIEKWRPVRANRWVQEEWRCVTLLERLQRLIEACDAALALPGGPGTLSEIALTWNLLLIGAISPKPLILIGPAWNAVFETFFTALDAYIPQSQRLSLTFVQTVDEAVTRLSSLPTTPSAHP